jgi:hypothetical protein
MSWEGTMKRRYIGSMLSREEESQRLLSSAMISYRISDFDSEPLVNFRLEISQLYKELKEELEDQVTGSCSCFRGDFYNPPETCDNCSAERDLEELNEFTSQLPDSLFNTLDLPGTYLNPSGNKAIRNRAFYYNLPAPFYDLARKYFYEFQTEELPREITSYWEDKSVNVAVATKREYLEERLNWEAQYLFFHNFCYQVALALYPEADLKEVTWYLWKR